jgi:hypothetical protein
VADTPRFFGTPFAAFSNAQTFTPWPSSIRAGHSYFSGGLEGGYNWQWGSVVLGIETDLSYLAAGGRGTGSFAATDTFSTTPTTAGTRSSMLSVSAGVDWLYTVRPRVGYALDRTLIYATGGLGGDLDVLVVAIGPQPPVALVTVLLAQGYGIEVEDLAHVLPPWRRNSSSPLKNLAVAMAS